MKSYKQFGFLLLLGVIMFFACNKVVEKDKLSGPSKENNKIAGRGSSILGSKAFCSPEVTTGIPTPGTGKSTSRSVAQSTTIFNTDFVTAGVGGLRNVGNGVITLAGVSGTITKAYLYWHGVTNSSTDVGNPIIVNGSAVTGINIGYSDNNCWGFANSQAYRSDVTALVTSTGNGIYNLSGFGAMNPNGASLVVFFTDANATNNRDVVIFEGNDSNVPFAGIPGNPNAPADPGGWDVTLSGINYTSGSANIQMHVSDGQVFPDAAIDLNGTTFVPAGAVFNGTTVPSANNGPQNDGTLWDIRSFDITSFLAPGPNSIHLTSGLGSDCLGLVVALIDLPAGAAPPPLETSVLFDFIPRTCPNPLDVRAIGQVVGVIMGTATFNVSQVDPTTIQLNGIAPVRVTTEDVGGPFTGQLTDCASCTAAGKDGIRDLRLSFDNQSLVSTLGTVIDGQCVTLKVTGKLLPAFGGTDIAGFDKAVVKRRK